MKNIEMIILMAVMGYLIGSVSVARLIFAYKRPGTEPDRIISVSTDGEVEIIAHEVGATNVMMAFGKKLGMTTMLLDLLKAFIPVLSLSLLFPDENYHLICGVFVLMGHLWPVWYRFSGGGGNSCILGMILALSPLGLIITQMGGMLIGRFYPRYMFIGGVLLSIPWFTLEKGLLSPEMIFSVIVSSLYILGQLPEAIAFQRFKKQGYTFDLEYVMNMMKHSGRKSSP